MTVTVHGPNGVTIHFPDGTDQATVDHVMRQATGMDEPAKPPMPDQGALDASVRGVGSLFPFMDEAVAGASATIQPLTSMLGGRLDEGGWSDRYNASLERQRREAEAAAEQHPIANAAGVVGGIAAALPRSLASGGLGLLSKVKTGMKVGAGWGAWQGFGNAEGGLGNRLEGAAEGAVTGGLTGGAIPVAGRLIKIAAKPAIDMITARTNPAGFAARKVVDRMDAGGRSVEGAAHRMEAAADNGDLLSLADVGGKQIQRLGRTVVNMPGKGSATLTARTNLEAMNQGGRIGTKVDEGLGTPGVNYQEAKHAIMDARSHAAEPYYREFYRTPVPYSRRLEEVLNTPAGRAGLAAARTNSLNRREPWAQWFLNVAEDGSLIDARRVPDARALDEVRRTIRAQMEDAMAAPHGQPFARPRDTPRSIAIRSVYDDLTDEMMRAGETRPGARNGPFARANAAALDNIQADDAIEFGRNIFKTDPRVIASRMGQGGPSRDRVFNAGQREIVRIGAADAVREKLAAKDFTHNGLLKFFSSREDVARLRPLFRSADDWRRFRTSMFNEARKRAKYDTFKTNSTTTAQLADMQEAGTLAEGAQTVAHAAHSGPVAAAASLLVRNLRRMGGLTPQVNEQIARLISTKDVAQVRAILRQLHNIELSRASNAQKLNAARNLLTAALASQEGRAMAPRPNEQGAVRYAQ